MDIEFKGNVVLKGKIVCDTGLYIGESNDSLEIGGIDRMVMRDKRTDLPYIPGSSLKGKLRSLLELFDRDSLNNIRKKMNENKEDVGPCNCGKCLPCKIFGFSNDNIDGYEGPTRIIVRDAFPDNETITQFWDNNNDLNRGTELKVENTIDRVKGSAFNPRPSERVPKSSKFDFEMVFSIYCDEDKDNFKEIFTAMKLLEENYLGGSGSRGYGQIHFDNLEYHFKSRDFYISNDMEIKSCEIGLLSEFNVNEFNL